MRFRFFRLARSEPEKGQPMSSDVPPAVATEIAQIAELSCPEGEQLRALSVQARNAGADPDGLLAAQLAGIAMNPVAYRRFDRKLDLLFTNQTNLNYPSTAIIVPEVIIGSGFHAAVYAAIRHLAGHPKPYVLQDGSTLGGAFAVTRNPSFFLNSENTGGQPGAPWDDEPNQLNWLPGAPVQACQISGRELTDNTVMRFIIRATLMLHARPITRATVVTLRNRLAGYTKITLANGRTISCKRVIDASGLGPEKDAELADGTSLLTWSQAMMQMDGSNPFRGMKRVAIIGGGKSALCAAEALLGIGPDATMRTAADGMPRVDLYSRFLPVTRESWLDDVPHRYSRLASHLPTGMTTNEDGESEELPGYGRFHDLSVFTQEGKAVKIPGGVLVNGRFYDHVVLCTGHSSPPDLILDGGKYDVFSAAGRQVARKARGVEVYRVGAAADLPWDSADYITGITENPENRVAMHRLGPLTAALAATLP